MIQCKHTLLAGSAVAFLLAGCASLPPEEDPVQLRLTDMETRLIRMERLLDNEGLRELVSQYDQLQRESQALRGEVETLRFELEQGQERQRQQYVDLDGRLESLEVGGVAAGGPGAIPVPGGNDEVFYEAAFELLQQGRYEEAGQAFDQFLVSFPDSPLADNAQYWLAETLYVRRSFEDALAQFENVVNEFPNSSRVPDAMLKIGYTHYELQRWSQARQALQNVMADYGDTTAAMLAGQRLDRMRSEGR